MIDQQQFESAVKRYFNFLISEFNYLSTDTIANGNIFFDCEFHKGMETISISYEVIEGYCQIFLIKARKKVLASTVKYEKLENLKELKKRVFKKISEKLFLEAQRKFNQFSVDNKFDKLMLNQAKDLWVYLNFNQLN